MKPRGPRGYPIIDVVADYYSGPIRVSWRKLRGHVQGERALVQRDTVDEWFQWRAERLEEDESKTLPVPAHIEHRDWTPKRRAK